MCLKKRVYSPQKKSDRCASWYLWFFFYNLQPLSFPQYKQLVYSSLTVSGPKKLLFRELQHSLNKSCGVNEKIVTLCICIGRLSDNFLIAFILQEIYLNMGDKALFVCGAANPLVCFKEAILVWWRNALLKFKLLCDNNKEKFFIVLLALLLLLNKAIRNHSASSIIWWWFLLFSSNLIC